MTLDDSSTQAPPIARGFRIYRAAGQGRVTAQRLARNAAAWLMAALLLVPCATAAAQDDAPTKDTAAAPVQQADDLNALVLQLTDRKAYEPAVAALIAIGGDDVEAIFQHIKNRELYLWQDRVVCIPAFEEDASGVSIGKAYPMTTPVPEEGQPMAGDLIAEVPEADTKRFKEQRKARKQIIQALAVIGLYNEDTGKRRAAAKKVGDAREASALPRLRELAASDQDAKTRFLAKESAALIALAGRDPDAGGPAAKPAAAQELGQLKSIRALDALKKLRAAEGISAEDAKAYDTAIARIQRHQTTAQWISHTFRGFSLGTILVLIALGLAITFGLMGVINMAHGEMLMIGAIMTWGTIEFLADKFPDVSPNVFFFAAFPIAFASAAVVGGLTELLIVRHLYKRPLDSLLATIGVSLALIQGVRLITGDNLSKKGAEWSSGGWEIYQDVILPYNRLFLIGLTIFAVLLVVVIFRYTRIGLMIRATVQNREMAQSLGVNTRRVDVFTFSLGAGLAGIAGYGIYLLSNVSPEMGQGYIVKAFLTVVVGGVGKLAGVVVAGLGLGFLEKLIEPIVLFEKPFRMFDAGWATVAVAVIVIAFIQRRPSGLFPDKGRMANQATGNETPWLAQSKSPLRRDLILGGILIFIGLIVIPALYATGYLSPSTLNKLGKFWTFAIVAIGMDLLWGYMGILSLCQFLFFALGGYCMGFYLINYGPMEQGIPKALAVVSSSIDKSAPWYLMLFENFWLTLALGVLIPGVVAFVIGATTFRSRVRGVYFSILTQAILVAFYNVWIKNDMKMGGTNGLTNFTHILGFELADKPYPKKEEGASVLAHITDYMPVALSQTRFWLYMATVLVLIAAIILTRWLVYSRFGRVLVAIRDDETRLRFLGYQTWVYKAAVFTLAGILAGVGGILFVPQNGIITPDKTMLPFWSIMVVVWVAVGGRATLWGAVLGAMGVSLLYDSLTSGAPDWYKRFCESIDFAAPKYVPDGSWLQFLWSPDSWPLMLGGLFILVPLALPGGVMSVPAVLKNMLGSAARSKDAAASPTIATPAGGRA